MPFREHLQELRRRLRNAVIALVLGCGVAYAYSQELFLLLAQPLLEAWQRRQAVDPSIGPPTFNFGSLIEPFWTYLSVSLWAGIFVASPFIFLQLWRFFAPGLYAKEKRYAIPFAAVSALFFCSGAAFCYVFVLPIAFDFFLSYSASNLADMTSVLGSKYSLGADVKLTPTLFMEQYFDLTKRLLLGFGLVFELPLVIFFLSWLGLVTPRGLWKFNRWAIVLSFTVGAILTPGPDVASQLLMSIPLVVLYNLSILVALVVARRKRRQP